MGLTRSMLQTNATQGELNAVLKTERDAFVTFIKASRKRNDPHATTIKPTE